jgi:proton-translocating NAD(P)+ transhydrogenase subunit beta
LESLRRRFQESGASHSFPGSLVKNGCHVVLEAGAGAEAGYPDALYAEQGARIVPSRPDVFAQAGAVIQVLGYGANTRTGRTDLPLLRRDQVLAGFLDPLGSPGAMREIAATGATAFAVELMPRITRAQSMDALSAMSTVIGYKASLMAFGKLQDILPARPVTYRGQNVMNLSLLAVAVAIAVYLVIHPGTSTLFPVVIALSLLFGVLLVIPIGGADMPTVISLLNSYAGLSAAAMGFVLDNKLLIIAGALDGSSGFVLSMIMCRAMNRSFTNVLFGAFGQVQATAREAERRPVRSATPEEAASILEAAQSVIIVPGYGMAVAQAQHRVRELYDLLTRRGTEVKFAIHPVAGRMPGHMNVLLAEADIPYDKLLGIDEINPEFPLADVALVIGANDITNPAARHDQASPIYGMPILDVDKAHTVMVIKRSMNPGFAGIDNELYYLDRTLMLFGDAKSFTGDIVKELAGEQPAMARPRERAAAS